MSLSKYLYLDFVLLYYSLFLADAFSSRELLPKVVLLLASGFLAPK